jgi:hypothetical protein
LRGDVCVQRSIVAHHATAKVGLDSARRKGVDGDPDRVFVRYEVDVKVCQLPKCVCSQEGTIESTDVALD